VSDRGAAGPAGRGRHPAAAPPDARGRPSAVADAALAAALATALPAPVRVLARRPSPYASSFPLAELDVESGDGARLTVVWKDLTPAALLPGARAARGGAPPDWPSADAELRAYELLDGADLGTPRRLAAVHERGRTWLFLEAVRGARLEHVGDPAAWEAAARWLAGAHAALTARAADPAWPPPWSPPDPADPAWPPPWSPPDVGTLAQRGPRVAALAPALEAARSRLAAAPPTVLHGELYAANVLIDGDRVCALDWETIARGPALLDLAALTAGAWEDPDERVAEAYRRALPDPPERVAFLAELDAARLLAAARWLAAPAGWQPPPEQARDWLLDAERIAGRLLI
jgi:Phosphotransferase enzyme family